MNHTSSHEPAWHPDPLARHEYRFWDGGCWTANVSDHGVVGTDPVTAPAEPQTHAATTIAEAAPVQQHAPPVASEPSLDTDSLLVQPPPFVPSQLPVQDEATEPTGPSAAGIATERLKEANPRRKEKQSVRAEQVATAKAPQIQSNVSAGPPPARPLHGKGVTGRIEVDANFVTIRRKGAVAKMNYGWTRGEKRIPIAAITAVQYKKPGATNGYIQFTISGGNESTRGIIAAISDENSVAFNAFHKKEFEAIRDHIEQTIVARSNPSVVTHTSGPDLATQLRDLAELRDDGIITPKEFDSQKARLLG